LNVDLDNSRRSAQKQSLMETARIARLVVAGRTFLAAIAVTTTAMPMRLAEGSQLRTSSPSRLRLEVTRDTWVSEVGREADGNNGGAPRLKLKSIQEMTLLDVDAASLRGRTIRSAKLHLKLAGDQPLRRVTVSSIGAEWFEGTGSNYAIQSGGATFRHRRHPELPWSIGGGDLCHVVLGNGGTIWRTADAGAPDQQGWQDIPVNPLVLEARAAGLSHGFLVFDDTGSEWSRSGDAFTLRLFPNRFIYSRDQNHDSAPYFTIELGPDDRHPPAAPSGLRLEPQTALLPAGETLVSWVTPRDDGPAGTLGFLVAIDGRDVPRELIPMAGQPGGRVELHLRGMAMAPGKMVELAVKAVDGAGNAGPTANASIQLSDRRPRKLPQPLLAPAPLRALPPNALPRLGSVEVAVLDELDKIDPITGELIPNEPEGYLANNHLWDASLARVTLQAARNEYVAIQVLLRGDLAGGTIQPQLTFDDAVGKTVNIEFGRYHPVMSQRGPLPDPIVQLAGSRPPLAHGTTSQSLHVELYIPHNLPAGKHVGTLTLSLRGSSRLAIVRLPVTLEVWDFTLPDHLSFLPEMNCYGLPDNDRDFYRLAHRHRTVLNRVPYNQNGQMQDGCAPEWDKLRSSLNWSAWDRRFGPLLDGSAFADLPRQRVPVDCFYLPLHENWPSPMEGNYNGDYWADRAFPESYRQAFVSAARQVAAHAQAKGWTDTLFQCFLNNKNNFKARGWSRGSSPWLLDEPANFQDYWALRYFARAFHEGINQALADGTGSQSPVATARTQTFSRSAAAPKFVFRADISRPQWRRDSLDGLLDYHVVGSAMRDYPFLVAERKRAFGEIVLEYGSTNPVEASNLQPVAWCLDVWALGADGVIPWQTVGTAESWERADELALLYPAWEQAARGGKSAGLPIPSIRLKAYRRGQQDVEYLTLWASLYNEPRWAVGNQVRAALNLAGTRQQTGTTDAEGAGRIDYSRLHSRDVWALRAAIGAALSHARPSFQRELIHFHTPRRDLARSAHVGEDTFHAAATTKGVN